MPYHNGSKPGTSNATINARLAQIENRLRALEASPEKALTRLNLNAAQRKDAENRRQSLELVYRKLAKLTQQIGNLQRQQHQHRNRSSNQNLLGRSW